MDEIETYLALKGYHISKVWLTRKEYYVANYQKGILGQKPKHGDTIPALFVKREDAVALCLAFDEKSGAFDFNCAIHAPYSQFNF